MHFRRFLTLASLATALGATVWGCGSTTELPLGFSNEQQLDAGGGGGAGNEASLADFSVGDGNQNNTDSSSDAPRNTGACRPLTCASAKANCGPVGDGCGNLLQCGTCALPETCGGGGVHSQCGQGGTPCTPKTCADEKASCGPVGDGCGGIIDCDVCPAADGGVDAGAAQCGCKAPQTCGGGGVPFQCGGSKGCVPRTCAQQGLTCGKAGDGCGGTVDCGDCSTGQSCGAVAASTCGASGGSDGGGLCEPKTCADFGFDCGPAGDGCGGLLDCGTCSGTQTCGGGGVPSKCGGSSGCVARTCAQVGATCGPIADGCGGTVDCGSTCAAPQTCGGGGTPSVCGGTSCVPLTCAQQNANCGPVADGCGSTIPCGNCTGTDICGGGGVPSRCGGGTAPDAGPTCTGLCQQQVQCDGGGTTSISGTVYAPTPAKYLAAGQLPDPIYNAVVYVPNDPASVVPFVKGVSCQQCGAEVSGSPLVKVFTGPDGKFTLTNVPAGANIPVVIQLGRWRRMITIPVTACKDNPLTQDQSRFPRKQAEGNAADNIPLTAIASGKVDTLECVLRKIGIDDTEFNIPANNKRVQFYQNNGAWYRTQNGQAAPGLTPTEATLTSTAANLDNYDMVLFPCEGAADTRPQADLDRVRDYAGAGGRLFITHYSYDYLFTEAQFDTTADWSNPDQGHPPDPLTGIIDQTFPKGIAFATWLGNVGALSQANPAEIQIHVPRHDISVPNGVTANIAQQWIYSTTPATVQHYTFNTPVSADPTNQCGRVVYSDFHVNDASAQDVRFPTECNNNPLTAQEKVLEFMLFDLASCIEPDKPPPPPPSCTKQTCQSANANCGPIGDGCNGVIDCGPCTPPQTCGGGGPSRCGGTGCQQRTCAQAGATCGPIGDGCGGTIDCGICTPPQTCGGGGVPSQCGNPSCIPRTCAQAGINCGPAGDGCGGLLDCGTCTDMLSCGGGGSPGVCGNSTCVPKTCADYGAQCGPVADGCGGIAQCGPCPAGQVCGGGQPDGGPGMPNKCGTGSCTPLTCKQQNASCGAAGDGCGGQLDCGTCPMGQTCGGGGVPNQCGSICTPLTCAQQNAMCGPVGDGCGGQLDCGTCTPPDTCGGGGVNFVCGRRMVH